MTTTKPGEVGAWAAFIAQTIDALHEGVVVQRPDGQIIACNALAPGILGLTEDEMFGRTSMDPRWRSLDPNGGPLPGDRHPAMIALATGVTQRDVVMGVHRPDGDLRWLSVTAAILDADDSHGRIVVSRFADITERHEGFRRLERSALRTETAEARFRAAFLHAPVGVAVVTIDAQGNGRILEANRSLAELTGRQLDGLHGLPLPDLLHPTDAVVVRRCLRAMAAGEDDECQHEVRIRAAEGRYSWTLLHASAATVTPGTRNPEPAAIVQLMDIAERKRFEGQLQYLADHDPLTGLFNRRRFEEELNRILDHAGRYEVPGAIMLLDLDGLKAVNDTLGHAAGDELVRRMGSILRGSLRGTDVIARLGGDEFGVLLPQVPHPRVEATAGKILAAIREGGVVVRGAQHGRVTASIGITTWGARPRRTAHELIIEADVAMYEAKKAGRDRCVVHAEADMAEGAPVQSTMLERLQQALDSGDGLVLYAQPVMALQDDIDRPDCYELLVRMVGDEGELISPHGFLDLAERYNLIQRIDRWVLARAVELIRAREQAGDPVRLTVNLSGRTLNDATFLRSVERLLRRSPIPDGSLTIEVTETEAIVNIERARALGADLRGLGCGFALDDFGAGFASLYYLKHLTFDLLKIDGEFIRELPSSPTDQIVVRAVVGIARALGTQTCAEFVGDAETVRLLRDLGVDFGQGFHLGAPRPIGDLLDDDAARHPARTY